MDKISICFVLSSDHSQAEVSDNFLKNYKLIYKPLVSFLYTHPECKITFSFTGEQISWYKKNYPEFLKLVGELSGRKQVEVLGGGYYDPVFPLLYPVDRAGQIELLSSEIRKTIGKRPRGLQVCASSWDPSLVSGFQVCGMEYVILDSSLIPSSKQYYLPIIAADKGKTLCILSNFKDFIPDADLSPALYIKNMVATIKKNTKDELFSEDEADEKDRIVPVVLRKRLLAELLKNDWFENFLDEIKNTESVQLSLPLNCRRNAKTFIPAYIPAGISEEFSLLSSIPFLTVNNKKKTAATIYDFLRTYPRQQALYNRMLYVSMLLNQSHGDKMRKKLAREKLWESQNGKTFICCPESISNNARRRLVAYKNLAEAEKLLRDSSDFRESITNFDYNCDGINEYLCQMKQYNACIGLYGGSVFEFNIMKNTGNYADNLSRIERFDGYSDKYERGFFIDSLFDGDEFDLYKKHRPTGGGLFPSKKYDQLSFGSKRNEIRLKASGLFSAMKQPVSLLKNYFMTSSGMMVQYILKNESQSPLFAKFVVESNFARPDETFRYSLKVVSKAVSKDLDASAEDTRLINNVSVVQTTDLTNDISFIFEPNENATLSYSQISFMRPDASGDNVKAGMTLTEAFCWDIKLDAGMETEKTINFSIVPRKKKGENS
ncbi:DUF1926 domain-containing protein [Treponema parvum]|uniref:DUF1926 domain-containing protein n=1 Tax=Treponema parvum TaxID=138851 RepID=A0A975F3G3_9SPIR|nr:alpha-amylase/4-alpha-glucanotransferase domain-containing protein [Treponema parvum]QTQ14015.1 DUF1926 domain-containing protein [Treponema parvum]